MHLTIDEFTIEAVDTFDGLSDVTIFIDEMEFDFNFSAREFEKLSKFCARMSNEIKRTENLGYEPKQ
jgi:hypothetical protein